VVFRIDTLVDTRPERTGRSRADNFYLTETVIFMLKNRCGSASRRWTVAKRRAVCHLDASESVQTRIGGLKQARRAVSKVAALRFER